MTLQSWLMPYHSVSLWFTQVHLVSLRRCSFLSKITNKVIQPNIEFLPTRHHKVSGKIEKEVT